MKKLLMSLLILTAMALATPTQAQDIVISERTAGKIESIRAKAAKEAADADRKMQQDIEKARKKIEEDTKKSAEKARKKMEDDTRKGAEKARSDGEKAIAKARENAEKKKMKAQEKADKEIAKVRAQESIDF